EADEEDERRRVLPGGVDGDHRVRRTRTAGDHGDARTPGQPGLGQGHEPGTALLTADDRVDGGVVESVEDVEVALAGHRVDPFDARGLQGGDDEVAGRTRHDGKSFRRWERKRGGT